MIDANVLRASGDTLATHQVAQRSRDFLADVLTICHRARLTETLKREWMDHASRFARTWRAAMARRGKLEYADDDGDAEVRGPASRVSLTPAQRGALDKDLHLLESALRADHIVVTMDVRLEEIVDLVKRTTRKLRGVRFVDPMTVTAAEL